MRRISVALALASVLAASSACSKVTYKNPGMVPTNTVEADGAFFVFGLLGTETIPVYQMCPTGVAEMQSKFTFGDLFLHLITFNLYAPRSYTITCGQPAGAPPAAPAAGGAP